jgi:glutamate-ammonia-ligase adenylyltransferase
VRAPPKRNVVNAPHSWKFHRHRRIEIRLINHPIPSVLSEHADRLAERFVTACQHTAIEFSEEDHATALAAWIVSPFIAEIAIADPQWFSDEIFTTDVLPRPPFYYRKTLTDSFAKADDNAAFAAIRRFRNRELARIAWRDIVCGVEVMAITEELSALADACIVSGTDWAAGQLAERFGRPCNDDGASVSMNVIGMGKLGGRELNFSSDIDLIFTYPASGTTHGGRRQVSNQEYFDKLGQRLIALLKHQTADGFVFRVDMRLRPFGDSGPLTSNFDALEHYYQLHGRDWERYAFIKARIITGAKHEQEKLQSLLKPFVYRRYLDFGALEAVREMKALIDAEVARKGLDDNVKLGPGGIREIEFIGQTFQLIRGGREPSLQRREILPILAICGAQNFIDSDDARALIDAYRFLRQTEHRLQQVNDRQTHQLPHEDLEQQRLAFGMGYPSYSAFAQALSQHRDNVRRCFRELLSPDEPTLEQSKAALSPAAALWSKPGQDISGLATLGFDDPSASQNVIEQLRNPRFLAQLSREALTRLNRVMPRLIEATAERAHSAKTFARLAELIQAIARRSVYLSLLADHPAALQRLIDLYHRSPWIAQQITQHPLLLDELLDPRILFTPPGRDKLVAQLETMLAAHASSDIERMMDTLRDFKNQQVLRVAASDMMDQFPVAEVSNQLSFIAAALLHHALVIAARAMTEKHGKPQCVVDGVAREVGFAIVAYGKLGGLELGYGSDLDLVFIHNGQGDGQVTDGGRSIDNDVYFTRLTQRIIHYLNTRTAAGRAYEIDTRLRPSGESGLLVSSITAFAEYQLNSAWTWEHQALIRARPVAGVPALMDEFTQVRNETVAQLRNEKKLKDDIVEMRERMRSELDRSNATSFDLKQGVGGITDIEFMVQYAVLRWAHDHHELLALSDNLRLLEVLTRLGFLTAKNGRALHDAYFAYRAEIHRCALQEIDGLVEDTALQEHRTAVTKIWHDLFATY